MIPLRLVGSLGAILFALIGAQRLIASIEQRGIDKCQAAHAQAAIAAQQENARVAVLKFERTQEVASDYQKRIAAQAAKTAAAEYQRNQLRIAIDDLSSRLPGETAEPGIDFDGARISLLGRLLGEAVDLAEECRAGYAGAASKVDALQSQIRDVYLK